MEVVIKRGLKACIVRKTDGDGLFYNTSTSSGESKLLYRVMKILNENGYDLVKRRMVDDGHKVPASAFYLRSRVTHDPKKSPIAIFLPSHSHAPADKLFREQGEVRLLVVEYCTAASKPVLQRS
jgi:hypothetical protein